MFCNYRDGREFSHWEITSDKFLSLVRVYRCIDTRARTLVFTPTSPFTCSHSAPPWEHVCSLGRRQSPPWHLCHSNSFKPTVYPTVLPPVLFTVPILDNVVLSASWDSGDVFSQHRVDLISISGIRFSGFGGGRVFDHAGRPRFLFCCCYIIFLLLGGGGN